MVVKKVKRTLYQTCNGCDLHVEALRLGSSNAYGLDGDHLTFPSAKLTILIANEAISRGQCSLPVNFQGSRDMKNYPETFVHVLVDLP